ncbi:MAG: Holliday junction branch migration protein RuvA [Oscillospiraceae bacterium]|nr:Holliday junction branch migration protein RuvA [Oscillospiraceae bacterium]
MFYSITGKIVHMEESMLALDCGGVAFACMTTANTLRELDPGEHATLFTYMNVREDAIELFGFAQPAELSCFKQLISVTGVGPKAALSVLSAFSPEQLAFYVAGGDAKSITRAQGVGPKLAQRIVLELKDKLQPYQGAAFAEREPGAGSAGLRLPDSEALAALIALGYQQGEASMALQGIDGGASTQEQIRLALRKLAREGR